MNLALVRGILACLLFTFAAGTQAQQRYVEGLHYQRVADSAAALSLAAADGKENHGKSVLEVFWYGCGFCYAFDPLLNDWVERKGDSIAFTRTPMVWDDTTRQHARLFYTTQALGMHDAMHTKIFDTIHQERNYLLDDKATAAFFAGFGVDADAYARTAGSFGVDADLRKTEAALRKLKLRGVPALIVGGTWVVNTTQAVPTHQAMLDVVDFLLTRTP